MGRTRIRGLVVLVVGLAATLVGRGAWAEGYAEKAGPHEIASLRATWTDAAREREVPVALWYPKDLAALKTPAPVIIFSHGLGGSRDTYAAYGKHWASYGYVVVFPQHHGSDTAVIGNGMGEMMLKGKGAVPAFLDRVADVHFVIDQVERLNAGHLEGGVEGAAGGARGERPAADYAVFKGQLDLKKIGMSGHSFGAITTQAVVGEFSILGVGEVAAGAAGAAPARGAEGVGAAVKLTEPRITAALAMSPIPAKGGLVAGALEKVRTPTFFLNGSEDKLMAGNAADRRSPFDHSTYPETYLLTLTGANHMTFAPLGRPGGDRAKFQTYILQSTTAYWDAFLKGDDKAKAWLLKDFAGELGDHGTFESKRDGK
jgi:predicted dienelactone hydrolase